MPKAPFAWMTERQRSGSSEVVFCGQRVKGSAVNYKVRSRRLPGRRSTLVRSRGVVMAARGGSLEPMVHAVQEGKACTVTRARRTTRALEADGLRRR